ncbi:MAG: cyclopropane fatty acyl phospholipid synthase [Deltaproteobacteria bacterium]|nr:cyclopropane fatty acyl phospholipid synthase [Deltaproteobacteria bacterium]
MHQDNFRHETERLLSLADIKISGDRPWDLQVHNDKLYVRLFAEGSLGFGESYMDGWWDCERPDEFFHRIFRAGLDEKVKPWRQFFGFLKARLFNLQKPSRSFEVGQRHYDIGNNLYQHILGKRLVYSCGYWENASTLDEAQKAKLELICRKLDLKPGMRVLDIGCGWGATARFIAKRYDVDIVGVTISKEQARFGQELCQGLPVEIRLQDYRSIKGDFDRILSIGMFEHVGYKNYETFMRCVRSHLKKDGIFLLHTIGINVSVSKTDPWIERYIFPNSMLPSKKQICDAAENLFVLEDWHNFGADYDKTLMSWFKNFHENWDKIKKNYDERFYRMWTYYLLACAGAFRARVNQVWQIVLSPEGIKGGYRAPR